MMLRKKALWHGLACVFAFVLAIAIMAATILEANRSAIDNALGTVSEKLVSDDDGSLYTTFTPDTAYLNSDGTGNSRALISAAIDLGRRTEAEGAVLLKNENNALPLASGSKVTLLGARSHRTIMNSGMGQKSQGCYISLEDALQANKTDFSNRIFPASGYFATPASPINDFNFSDLKYGGDGAEAGANFELNPTTISAYEKTVGDMDIQPAAAAVYKVGEPSVDELKAAEMSFENSFTSYGDAAIVVVGRGAGESYDYIKGGLDESEKTATITEPLQLTQNERDIIDLACNNFKKVIVLVNTNSAIEIGDLKDNDKISAILWIGHPGNYGLLGVADILCGKANPSGALYDLYATSNLSAPAMQNMGDYTFSNVSDITRSNKSSKYVLELEGLYVGYRYYETRYYDAIVNPSSNASSGAGVYASTGSSWNYGQEVTYGFGYGLSYTTFKYEMVGTPKLTYSAHEIYADVTVKVTNTGNVDGKTSVQIYAQAPYTEYDKTHSIEKSAIQLLNFEKTDIIKAGDSETVTVTCDLQNLASYESDYKNADGTSGTYILDNGNYYFSVGNGAHDALNNILAKQGKGNDSKMVGSGDATLAVLWEYNEGKDGGVDATTFSVSKNNVQIQNQIDYIDWNTFGGQKVTYLSRSDWNATYPEEYISIAAPADMIDLLDGKYYTIQTSDDTSSIKWNSTSTDYKFYQMKLSDWDDYRWNDLLNQISLEQATVFASNAGPQFNTLSGIDFKYLTAATDNAGNGIVFTLAGTKDSNAPWSITTGEDSNWNGQVLGSAPVVASTFDPDLMYETGEFVGNEALFTGLPIVWGPGLNTHRHAYNGRNGEYYSEDPVLSGTAAMEFAVGARKYGLIAAAKHFVFNDQETNRQGVAPFKTEQSAREIELRAYQIAIEAVKYDGEGLIGIMTSFSKCGPVEVSCSYGMLTGILQNEWGFHGYAVTDILDDTDLYACMVYAGATGYDLRYQYPSDDTSQFGTSGFTATQANGVTLSDKMFAGDATMQNILKTSVKRTLWTFAQSNLMNRYSATTRTEWQMTSWRAAYISAIVIAAVLVAGCAALYVVATIKKKEEE